MYKVKNKMTPVPFQEIFTINKKGDFCIPKINTVNRGEETVRYRGPKIWEIVPEEIKKGRITSYIQKSNHKMETC